MKKSIYLIVAMFFMSLGVAKASYYETVRANSTSTNGYSSGVIDVTSTSNLSIYLITSTNTGSSTTYAYADWISPNGVKTAEVGSDYSETEEVIYPDLAVPEIGYELYAYYRGNTVWARIEIVW